MGVGQTESISECGGYAASLLPNQLPINTRSVWPTDDGSTSRVPVLQRGDLHGISGPPGFGLIKPYNCEYLGGVNQ